MFPRDIQAQFFFYDEKYFEKPFLLEVGIGAGGVNSLTDIGGKKGNGKPFLKDLNVSNTRFYGSIFAGVTYKDIAAVRLQAGAGKIVGYDSILKNNASNSGGRYERNLSFRSRIAEIMIAGEFHPLSLLNSEDPSRWSPYILAGAGVFLFEPEAQLNGVWYSLQPLRTEGQGTAEYKDRKIYKLTQLEIPLGFGIRYEISPLFNVRLEFIHRLLFTDYLDDVSTNYIDGDLFFQYLPPNLAVVAQQLHDRRQELDPTFIRIPGDQRGDPRDKDAWLTLELKVGFTLRKRRF